MFAQAKIHAANIEIKTDKQWKIQFTPDKNVPDPSPVSLYSFQNLYPNVKQGA
jgi:hypothetical protein